MINSFRKFDQRNKAMDLGLFWIRKGDGSTILNLIMEKRAEESTWNALITNEMRHRLNNRTDGFINVRTHHGSK